MNVNKTNRKRYLVPALCAVLILAFFIVRANSYSACLLLHKMDVGTTEIVDSFLDHGEAPVRILTTRVKDKPALARVRKGFCGFWICDEIVTSPKQGQPWISQINALPPRYFQSYTVENGGPLYQGAPEQEWRCYFLGADAVNLIALPDELTAANQLTRVIQNDSEYVIEIISWQALEEGAQSGEEAALQTAEKLYDWLAANGKIRPYR